LENVAEIEMGIGVHTGQVVVGNIGSPERMKYGVIGSQVNLTSRIQSCTTGGQILISEITRQEIGRILKIGRQMEVKAKGVEHPVTLFEVLGISGRHKLLLPDASEDLVPLVATIPFRYEIVEASQLGHEAYKGMLTKLSLRGAEAMLDHPISNLTNIKMHLMQDGGELPASVYAKVIDVIDVIAGSGNYFSLRFTSVSPEIERFFQVRTSAAPIP
jgi:adenylate cyclase